MASSGAKRRAPEEFEKGSYPSKRRSDVASHSSSRDSDSRKAGSEGKGRFGGRNGNYEDDDEPRGSAVRRRSRSPARRDDRHRRRERSPPLSGRRYDQGMTRDAPNPPREAEPQLARPSQTAGRSQPSSYDPLIRMRRKRKPKMKDEAKDEYVVDESEIKAMQELMGFKTFMTTKETKVPGNEYQYAVRKEKKTEYRQYMNRVGGFNRPLSPSSVPHISLRAKVPKALTINSSR